MQPEVTLVEVLPGGQDGPIPLSEPRLASTSMFQAFTQKMHSALRKVCIDTHSKQ
jgi:hypothetical protein